ncbi:flagellar brake domain-containing protein [Pseudoalteromonas mariniglutinosa]|uniref:flagellar brake domain-containing protein n=1 Tax=Pseudoalteromonas mariniglutinosa TaxID=206042 RepID=UPI00384A684B
MVKTALELNCEKLAHIPAGSLVDVEIITPVASKRVKTEFIGLLQEQFVILNYPSTKRLANMSDYLKDGVTLVVRAVLESGGGQVIAFRQQIHAISSHPARLLFIDFPKQVQYFNLRAEARIPTLFPAVVKINDEQKLTGVIKDISLTGVLFDVKSKDDFSALKRSQCKVLLDQKNNTENEFQGQICSIRVTSETTQFGIQLLASEAEMNAFMKHHLIDLSVLAETM